MSDGRGVHTDAQDVQHQLNQLVQDPGPDSTLFLRLPQGMYLLSLTLTARGSTLDVRI